MKVYRRQYPLFSLCGLNCGLCPMYIGKYCPGCGGGPGNQPCVIVRCSCKREGIDFCYQCKEYPCEKYEGIEAYDSFITHRNQLKDFEKVRKIGLETYQSELVEKMGILEFLLANYNDGRRKSFFCIAVNLLELQDLKSALEQIPAEANDLPFKEKSAYVVNLLQTIATERKVQLKLNKKPS